MNVPYQIFVLPISSARIRVTLIHVNAEEDSNTKSKKEEKKKIALVSYHG